MSQAIENKVPLTPSVAEEMRQLITQFNGNEVFMVGTCTPDGVVNSIEPMAFGNQDSVPAPAQMAASGQVLIHNHPSGYLEPSGADISIASVYGKAGIGFYITNNNCDNVRVVVKPFFPKAAEPVYFSTLENLFGANGTLSQSFRNYEFRPQQLAMMKTVSDAYNKNQITVIEAGTGVGKSFAYLAPSILWALANKRRVVISTNTINLQEQLLIKDLPELARQMNVDFKAVLVKGRGNYLSMRRLKYASTRADFFYEDRSGELESLQKWANNTTDGSRSDLPFQISEDTWEAAMSDKDDCLRAECQFFNQCHYYNSRREAANADIIIANHHLVMADMALRLESKGNEYAGILPPFDRVIFDEAHNLEEVATSYFTSKTSIAAIRRQFFRITRLRDRAGLLQSFYNTLKKHSKASLSLVVTEILDLIMDKIIPVREEVEVALRYYFDEFFAESLEFFHADDMKDNERREFRITSTVVESSYWEKTRTLLEQMLREFHRFFDLFNKMEQLLVQLPDEIQNELMESRLRLFGAVKKLSDHEAALRFFLSADKSEYCRWVEIGYRRGQPYIFPHTAPLDISRELNDALFSKKNTVILTSATLSIDKNFNYFRKQMGLLEDSRHPGSNSLTDRCTFLQLDTPFDYRKNCIIGIPCDIPLPSDPAFLSQISPAVIEAVKITKGKAMILFTSYRQLRQTAELCRAPLAASGITSMMQGEIPRHQLVENFKSAQKAVLFATSSFWEGVDIQGDALQCLIITKLPFSVPSTPILEARAEMIERNGGNAFYEISVPQAVIKFKQGFGRLIRSHADKGYVLIFDNRVLVQRYGKIFMRSLPPARVIEGPAENVLKAAQTFMVESPLVE